jgi:phosphohistidine phosphatase SixA
MARAASASEATSASQPSRVLVMRHALTEPGIGDPPGYRLDRCETQRNLSAEGRSQARAFGERLRALGWRPIAVRTSHWCRCGDTARAVVAGLGGAAVETTPWTALDSFFDAREREGAQTAALRQRLRERPAPPRELWVTHQVNITALVGGAVGMGQALWLAVGANGALTSRPFES